MAPGGLLTVWSENKWNKNWWLFANMKFLPMWRFLPIDSEFQSPSKVSSSFSHFDRFFWSAPWTSWSFWPGAFAKDIGQSLTKWNEVKVSKPWNEVVHAYSVLSHLNNPVADVNFILMMVAFKIVLNFYIVQLETFWENLVLTVEYGPNLFYSNCKTV